MKKPQWRYFYIVLALLLTILVIPLLRNYGLTLLFALATSGPSNYTGTVDLPIRGIVFQHNYVGYGATEDDYRLWFINADGNDLTYVDIPSSRGGPPANPVYTLETDWCVFSGSRTPSFWHAVKPNGQYLSYESADGKEAFCGNEFSPIHGSSHIASLLWTQQVPTWEWRIYDLNPKTGRIVDYYDFTDDLYWEIIDIGINAYHDNNLVFTRYTHNPKRAQLVIRNFNDDTETVIYKTETSRLYNPAFSPDGNRVVFVDREGVKLIHLDETPHRIELLLDYYHAAEDYNMPMPSPSWSPDGEWIVYHRLHTTYMPSSDSDHGIYKLNVNTKEEVLLIDEGIYPFWRTIPQSPHVPSGR